MPSVKTWWQCQKADGTGSRRFPSPFIVKTHPTLVFFFFLTISAALDSFVFRPPQLSQMRSFLALSLFLLVLEAPVFALIFPFEVRNNLPTTQPLSRRTPVPISNTGNAQYVSNITIGGQTLRVLLDTGRLVDICATLLPDHSSIST